MTRVARRAAVISIRTTAHGDGGVQVHAEYLLDVLESLGWEGDVLTSALPPGTHAPQRARFRYHYLPGTVPGLLNRRWWTQSLAAFRELHRSRAFDLVLSEGYSGWPVVRLPHTLRPPVVYWSHGFEPEHVLNRWHDVEGAAAFLKYALVGIPETLWFTYVERDFVRRAERVVVSATHILLSYRRYYRAADSKCSVILNWVDLDRFRPDPDGRRSQRHAMKWEAGHVGVLLASAVTRQKGLHVGLNALAYHRHDFPGPRVAVVGDGPYLGALRTLVRRRGLEPICSFLGRRDQQGMGPVYGAADLFIMPTLRREGMPYTVLEAMASGLPVIASERGGNAECLGEAGILVPAGDCGRLHEALRRLLGDPQLRLELGRRARKRAEALFGADRATPQVRNLLESLLGNSEPPMAPRGSAAGRTSRPSGAYPVLAICISTRDRSRLLRECLEAIADQRYGREYLEVLVFDDASSPEESAKTREAVEGFRNAGFRRVHLVRSELNVKMLVGRQTLAQGASPEAEHLLFLDDDGALEAETLEVLVGTLQARPDIGAVGPRIVAGADRQRTLHAAFFMHPWTGLYTMRESEVPMPCDWVNMTCALFRKEAYLKVGGFDVSFEHSQEEADLCLRLRAAGYGVLYQPRATAVHKVAPGTVRRERLYHFYRNKCWVIRKNFRGLRRLTALGFHAVPGTVAHLLESIRFHRTICLREWRVIFKATWDGLHR